MESMKTIQKERRRLVKPGFFFCSPIYYSTMQAICAAVTPQKQNISAFMVF